MIDYMMSVHYFTQYLLVFLLVYADCTYSKEVYIHGQHTQSNSCPQSLACVTLSQFADSINDYYNGSDTNVSLVFLPGNHSLDRELSLANLNNFSLSRETQHNQSVTVKCSTKSARFLVSNTTFVSIKGLNFVDCGGNTISVVKELVINDSIFLGVERKGTGLVLRTVSGASIVKSSFEFHSNINITTTHEYLSKTSHDFCLEQNSIRQSGALYASSCNITIINSRFTWNKAATGGVLVAYNSTVYVANSIYSYNQAGYGGVMFICESTIYIHKSTFTGNTAAYHGGVMWTYGGTISINDSNFTGNRAGFDGGVMLTGGGTFSISDSNFTGNTADGDGGVMETGGGTFSISHSNFTGNRAVLDGGVMWTGGGTFSISDSNFTGNTADGDGGMMWTLGGTFRISDSNFTGNTAGDGGVMLTDVGTLSISDSNFTGNRAVFGGGVIEADIATIIIFNSIFELNEVNKTGVMFLTQCNMIFENSTFYSNVGSLYTFSGNLTFIGYTNFENCSKPLHKSASDVDLKSQEGGAITSFQSTVTFTGVSSLLNNQARHGGAILAIDSTIKIYGNVTVANNSATDSNGGGISLQHTNLDVKGNCYISNNNAVMGGGVHATGSTVAVYQPGTLQLINNSADKGGGVYLGVNPKLYLLVIDTPGPGARDDLLVFKDNKANYGAAVYVDDVHNSGACSPNIECFIQVLALYQYHDYIKTVHLHFRGNNATQQGSNLFGGLVDRCIPSQFSEVYHKPRTYYTGVTYLENISDIDLDSTASLPVRICFCNTSSEPDCSYQPPTLNVKKGETFNLSLVAVDHVNHTVAANIISSLSSSLGGLGEGQQNKTVGRKCTALKFNVFSQREYETINIFADGPCKSNVLSTRNLTIHFLNCTCPVGFEPLSKNNSTTKCECKCDSKLSPYITNCNSTTGLLVRMKTNSWINYINDTDKSGYVIDPNCPFDYCQPPSINITFDLSLSNGADAQCAYNRIGVLCGSCQHNLSLSLGSSRCLPCNTYWPVVLVVILIASAIAGVLLVTAILVLNVTVAIGLINGFIFYANIVAAGSTAIFPSSEPSFPTVFVAWLNLDIGFDVCFFDGLDTYTKTWLTLAFPVYIISLVVIIIIVSEYSPRFAGLIGRKDPVATLATLILLSYAKLLSITVSALSFSVLHYPDGTWEAVWLPDGNMKFFEGKHIPLAIVALLIIMIGLPYTVILFFWQWLVRAHRLKVFKWTRNAKLNAFVATYHAPYNSKYRYWTGLLLLVRVVLYITESVTVSSNPQVLLLTIILLVGGLFFMRSVIQIRVYRKSLVDIVGIIIYFNILASAAVSLYDFKANITKQTAVAYISTLTTLILLIGAMAYHAALLTKRKKAHEPEELEQHDLPPDQLPGTEVTYSVIELPKHDQRPQLETSEDEVETMEDCQLLTPVYQ